MQNVRSPKIAHIATGTAQQKYGHRWFCGILFIDNVITSVIRQRRIVIIYQRYKFQQFNISILLLYIVVKLRDILMSKYKPESIPPKKLYLRKNHQYTKMLDIIPELISHDDGGSTANYEGRVS